MPRPARAPRPPASSSPAVAAGEPRRTEDHAQHVHPGPRGRREPRPPRGGVGERGGARGAARPGRPRRPAGRSPARARGPRGSRRRRARVHRAAGSSAGTTGARSRRACVFGRRDDDVVRGVEPAAASADPEPDGPAAVVEPARARSTGAPMRMSTPSSRSRDSAASTRRSIPPSMVSSAGPGARSTSRSATAPLSEPVRVSAALRPGGDRFDVDVVGVDRRRCPRLTGATRRSSTRVAHARAHKRAEAALLADRERRPHAVEERAPGAAPADDAPDALVPGVLGDAERRADGGRRTTPAGACDPHGGSAAGRSTDPEPEFDGERAHRAAPGRPALGGGVQRGARRPRSRATVPPSRSDASSSVTRRPNLANSRAATSPAMPPPTTTTCARARAAGRRARRAAFGSASLTSLHPPTRAVAPAGPTARPRCETGGMTLHITGDADADRLLTDDPARAADRHAARPAGRDGDRLLRAAQDPAAGGIGGCRDPRRATTPTRSSRRSARRRRSTAIPGSMAGRVQALCAAIEQDWGGDAAAIWTRDDPPDPRCSGG